MELITLKDLKDLAKDYSTEGKEVNELELSFENGEVLSIPLECINEFRYNKISEELYIHIINNNSKISKKGLYYKDNKYNPLSRLEGKDLCMIGYQTQEGYIPLVEIEFVTPIDAEMNLTKEELDYYFPQNDISQFVEYNDYNDIIIHKDLIKYYSGVLNNQQKIDFAKNKIKTLVEKVLK